LGGKPDWLQPRANSFMEGRRIEGEPTDCYGGLSSCAIQMAAI
jgi:hypothetical protein